MLSKSLYEDFFSSSFLSECRKRGMTTNDIFIFFNSFFGARNFIRNHPRPVIDYYWQLSGGPSIKQIAERFDIPLKKRKFVSVEDSNIEVAEDECLIGIQIPIGYAPECYGGIENIKKNIRRAAFVRDLRTCDIIQNENLWEECEYIQNSSYSIRHSSDEIEHHSMYKTGWAFLVDNQSVVLDLPLIAFLKNRNITLKKECVQEYMAYPSGSFSPIETLNGLMAFRAHPIKEDLVPVIMNDPVQWEGIFYDQKFCNESILKYVKSVVSTLDDILK